MHSERVRNHIFISGIPNELIINNQTINEPNAIIHTIINNIVPEVSQDEYTVMKSFQCRTGHTRHSAKIICKKIETKGLIVKNRKKLNSLEA